MISLTTHSDLKQELEISLNSLKSNAICRRIWLGHGNVIFVIMSRPNDSDTQQKDDQSIEYELHTHFAEWAIYHDQEKCNRQTDSKLILALTRQVVGLTLNYIAHDIETGDLSLYFTQNWKIVITPWPLSDLTPDELSTDAWAIKLNNLYYGVTCEGIVNIQVLE